MKSTPKRTVTKPHKERSLNPDTVGGRIWRRREQLQMTREELARRLTDLAPHDRRKDVDHQKVWRVETNQTRLVVDDLRTWVTALKTTVNAIVPV